MRDGEAEEGKEVTAIAFVLDGEAAIAEQSCDCALDLLPVPSEACGGLETRPGDPGDDAALPQPGRGVGGVVCLVARSFPGRRRRAPHRGSMAVSPSPGA